MSTCSPTGKIHHAPAMSPRRKRTLRIAVCLIAAALLAPILIRIISRSREPSYDGHPLSFWVIHSSEVWEKVSDDADKAIRGIGTNAIPYLLDWMTYQSFPQDKVRRFIARLLPIQVTHRFSASEQRAYNASRAFCALGTNALCAIPGLARIAASYPNSQIAIRATLAIRCILFKSQLHHKEFGVSPSPALACALIDENLIVREEATNVLRQFRIDLLRRPITGIATNAPPQ